MEYLIDSGNLSEIERVKSYYPLAGVTTNPYIFAEEQKNVTQLLPEIREVIGADMMLHAQVLSEKWSDMVDEAALLKKLAGRNFYVKIPVIPEGIKAMKELKKKGYQITATAVFTPQQAQIAALAGADYVAPYVHRIEGLCVNGTDVVADTIKLFELGKINSKVLAASFTNIEQIHKCALAGAHAVTIDPPIFDELIYHPLTTQFVDKFFEKGKPYYKY